MGLDWLGNDASRSPLPDGKEAARRHKVRRRGKRALGQITWASGGLATDERASIARSLLSLQYQVPVALFSSSECTCTSSLPAQRGEEVENNGAQPQLFLKVAADMCLLEKALSLLP
jgi:hypothetical protein